MTPGRHPPDSGSAPLGTIVAVAIGRYGETDTYGPKVSTFKGFCCLRANYNRNVLVRIASQVPAAFAFRPNC
eukprot:1514950-Amphidinium_carterae.1